MQVATAVLGGGGEDNLFSQIICHIPYCLDMVTVLLLLFFLQIKTYL